MAHALKRCRQKELDSPPYLLVQKAFLDKEDFPVHRHGFAEITVIASGEGIHVEPGARLELRAGDSFVFLGEDAHGFDACRRLELYNVMYAPRALSVFAPMLRALPGFQALFRLEPNCRRHGRLRSLFRLAPADLDAVLDRLRRMTDECERQSSGWEAAVTALFGETVVLLSRSYGGARARRTATLARLGRSLQRLETIEAGPLRLADLAALSHFSANQFLRLFREATNESPVQYRLRAQMRKACELLGRMELSIGEVASACGFDDSNYFCRQFRRIAGMSPRDYRKRRGG